MAHRRDDAGHLHLVDPEGYGVELMPFTPRDPYPDVGQTTATLPGFRARKLGHVNVLTGQLAAMRDFYRDALGMSITDYLGDEGVWLHINADHHVMALVGKTPAHFHHFALDLVDWGNLRVAFDHLGQHGRWLGWGPVRHALGQNLCGYVRIPEEHLLRRAVLRHGGARPPAHGARMARRPARLEPLGHPAAALVLSLRRGRRGIRAPPARGARHAAAAALSMTRRVVRVAGWR